MLRTLLGPLLVRVDVCIFLLHQTIKSLTEYLFLALVHVVVLLYGKLRFFSWMLVQVAST